MANTYGTNRNVGHNIMTREQARRHIAELTVKNLDYLTHLSMYNRGPWLRIMGLIETWIIYNGR